MIIIPGNEFSGGCSLTRIFIYYWIVCLHFNTRTLSPS